MLHWTLGVGFVVVLAVSASIVADCPPNVEDVRINEIRVRNTGGRDHTFTEVARFGNGFVPVVNAQGAFTAPECSPRRADRIPTS